MRNLLTVSIVGAAMTTFGADLYGDEGMWLLNRPPRDLLEKRHGFKVDDAWLERVMKASVRFNNGGSGSFVSPHGLVLTNHHIGAGSLQKLSPKDKDYHRDGYLARTPAEELKCPDLELNVLQEILDVTQRVNDAVPPNAKPAEAFAARRARMAEIEQGSLKETGLRSDVVTLYQGGMYHLYRYKKYTDVRLVMAPEHGIAFFGGDTDNFEFPRHNLDICFFRVYENDRPIESHIYFPWNADGPSEGDLVFVSGHPGSTNRLETLARLEHRRDVTLPYVLNRLRTQEALLRQFSEQLPEREKMAKDDLHRFANARKAISGQYQGLLDPVLMAKKAHQEKHLRDRIDADAELKQKYGDAWDQIAAALKDLPSYEREFFLLERGDAFDCELYPIARHLVRMAAELPKKSTERLREYRDSNLESLKFQLFSPAPIHAELEQARLMTSLTFFNEVLGSKHPLVTKAMAGKSPADRAAELVGGTKLADPAERKRIFEGLPKSIETSNDPMLALARLMDEATRKVRARHETEVEEVERQAYAKITAARFHLDGETVAPDATFTLRLAFGIVKGYEEFGRNVPYTTTFGGAFELARLHGGREPFNLPERWKAGKDKLNLTTPFNFVSTADTIGGNSGSPVLNRKGELVGVNFDRNRHGLVRNFVYTDERARHISVHSKGILEVLAKLYDADALVRELTANR
jgi:hypothetical protein